MKKVRKIGLKPKFSKFLKIMGVILCICLGIFLFYTKEIHDLTKLGYSREASQTILFSFQKDYILSVGENATLNKAFESEEWLEENLDSYRKIKFVKQEHFISNINKLLKIGYSPNEINIIFAHGNDESVSRFTKREKIRYLEEFFIIDYAKLDFYDRYVAYSDATGEDEELTVLFVNLDLDKEDYTETTPVYQFSIDMVVNKHRNLDENFVPDDLTSIDKEYASSDDLQCSRLALNAFREMSKAAEKDGYSLVINSAYRSYQDQVALVDEYLKLYGQNYVNKYVAKPGYSEHQTGLAFDIGSRRASVFANSKEYVWMQEHAHEYGFIRRFSKKEEIFTGFRDEPWHYRYVGKEIAGKIHEENISLEEYWAIYLDTR